MGSCVSVHKNSESTVKLQSPIRKITVNSEQLEPQSSSLAYVPTFGDLGSKEEKFFDSQPWLESDCEDFFSINGDFTPSRDNTPIHQSSFIQTPQLDNSLSIDTKLGSISEPSPTDNVKKLADLFRESFSEIPVDEYQNFRGIKTITCNQKPEGNHTIQIKRTQHISEEISVCSNEMTQRRVYKSDKQKLSRSVSCCLPNLARSLSFRERKKRLSPADIFGR